MDDFSKKLKNKIYYLENRKRLIQNQKIYNEENKEHIKEYQKQYRSENFEYIRKLNKDNIRTKDKTELMLKRYKAKCKKLGLKCTVDLEAWNSILDYFNQECCFCHEKSDLVLGFIIPYSKGGHMVFNNVVPCCKFHRKSKHNRLLEGEWLQWDIIKSYNFDKANKVIEYINMS